LRDEANAALTNAKTALENAKNELASYNNVAWQNQTQAEISASIIANAETARIAEEDAKKIYEQAAIDFEKAAIAAGVAGDANPPQNDDSNISLGVNDPNYILANAAMQTALATWQAAMQSHDEAVLEAQSANDIAYSQVFDMIAAAQAAVGEAESFVATCEAELKTKNQDIASNQEAYSDAVEAVEDAVSNYEDAKSNTVLAEQIRQNNIRLKNNEIEEQKEAIANLAALTSAEGVVYANTSGTVAEVTTSQGATTTNADYVRISTGQEGYMVEFYVTPEQARNIRVGSTVTLSQAGNYWMSGTATVYSRGAQNESGQVPMRAQLGDMGFADGDAVSVNLLISDQMYWNCVPISAIRPSEGGGSYVLVINSESSVLGNQSVARKVDVTILAQNSEYAAIDNIYDYETQIIVSATKPVNDGDAVRITEETA
jgi:hypothetical protein